MRTIPFSLLAELAADPRNGWSIGTFGAIGEFTRNADEPAQSCLAEERIEIVTERGGLRIDRCDGLQAIAWDSLSKDGESWGFGMAVCAPIPETEPAVIRSLGTDSEAIRVVDREHCLYSLGVGHGAVEMTLRTGDAELIAAMDAGEGKPFVANKALMSLVMRIQPHRVLLSPVARIEVFQPVPPPDGKSPQGPHTHLLPKLLTKARPHSSNIPIPEGYQAVLNLHPRSPWRDALGERHAFRSEYDKAFAPILDQYGSREDSAVERMLRAAIERNAAPEFAEWPTTRRGRTKARIVLRRMAAAGDKRVVPWRAIFDRAPIKSEEGENP